MNHRREARRQELQSGTRARDASVTTSRQLSQLMTIWLEVRVGGTLQELTGFLMSPVAREEHFLLEGHVLILLLTRTEREVLTRSVFTNLKLTILNILVLLSPECPFS